ncbi:MAG: preprotein translocase subunit SecB [Clostridiaceae bacterium]|nr:preprotein translocase subunit SecB [Clostridiaceae bacterium]
MINGKAVKADFQFIGNRVRDLEIHTKMIDTIGKKVSTSFEFDYNIIELCEEKGHLFGVIEFLVKGKAKAGKSLLFSISLAMEGAFVGNPELLSIDKFKDMLELNGVITLSQISRSFLISVTSQSGINPPVRLPMINVFALREQKRNLLQKKDL